MEVVVLVLVVANVAVSLAGEEEDVVAGVPEGHERSRALVNGDGLDGSLDEVPRIPDVDLALRHLGESSGHDSVERSHPLDAGALDARV